MEARGVDLNCRRYLWSTSCMVVRIDKDGLEWFQIGDSLALVLYEDGSHRLLADPIDHDRETLCLWKEWEPSATGTIRDSLADQILKVREGMNRAPTHRFKEQWGAEVRPLAWHIFFKKPNSWSPNRESLVIEPWKQLDLNLSRETGPELRRWISLYTGE